MTAEIVSVGTELLLGQVIDTNAAVLGRLLAELGFDHTFRQTVGDNLDRLIQVLQRALSRSDIVFTIGGLGPTADDITREGIAGALNLPLEPDFEMERTLREMFASRKLTWIASNARQSMRPSGAQFIENPNGSAPGLMIEKDGKWIYALPGPKGEFTPMAHGPVQKHLQSMSGGGTIHSRVLRVCGIGESAAEDKIKELLDGHNPTIAPYAKLGEVHFRLTARAPSLDEANSLLDPLEAQVRGRLGDAVYGTDDTTLEAATLEVLRQKRQTVSVAESCTGGMLGARLSSVPGASHMFTGGIICYTSSVKESLLGVRPTTISTFGTVSPECATEMAEGCRMRLGSDYALAITGEAGPESFEDKPIGLIYTAVAGPDTTVVEEHHFRGLREDIRFRATQSALMELRNLCLTTK